MGMYTYLRVACLSVSPVLPALFIKLPALGCGGTVRAQGRRLDWHYLTLVSLNTGYVCLLGEHFHSIGSLETPTTGSPSLAHLLTRTNASPPPGDPLQQLVLETCPSAPLSVQSSPKRSLFSDSCPSCFSGKLWTLIYCVSQTAGSTLTPFLSSLLGSLFVPLKEIRMRSSLQGTLPIK